MARDYELEEELGSHETLHEDELEQEGIFGALGNALGGLLGEGEDEYEMEGEGLHELEGLHEDELEGLHEDEFEGLHEGVHEYEGLHEGLHEDELEGLHEGVHEYEGIHEYEGQHEGVHEYEDESGEMFFKGIGRFLKRAAPILKSIAKVAVPLVSTAVGGPLGGMLGKVATSALGEGEEEWELEGLHEDELESEAGHEYEAHLFAPLGEQQALAELMASVAAEAESEAEAEAMIGAATLSTMSAYERRQLRRVLAHMVRGSAILTRLLRRRAITRPAIRTVPMIVDATANTLIRRAAAGQPITRRAAGRTMAIHTRRILSNPRVCGLAIQRNVAASRRIQARRGIPTVSRPIGVPRAARRSNGVVRGVVRRPVVGAVRHSAARRRY